MGTVASVAFDFAYDNNFLGVKTGLDWAGKQLDKAGEAISDTASAMNPKNWSWGW